MKIEVTVTKRYFFAILSVLIILGAIGIGVAFGTNSPSDFGHSAGEIEIDIGGNSYTLQEAVTQGLLSSGNGDCRWFVRTNSGDVSQDIADMETNNPTGICREKNDVERIGHVNTNYGNSLYCWFRSDRAETDFEYWACPS
jgi:hypothetical protein